LSHRHLDLIGIADVADGTERGAPGGLDVGDNSVHIGGHERKNSHLRAFRREQLRRGAAMPRPAPVTMATFPSSRAMFISIR
jgi:hypothetical protein